LLQTVLFNLSFNSIFVKAMNTKRSNIKKIARIKLSVLILMTASVIGASATMGIYSSGKNSDRPKTRLLAPQSALKPGTFSLKSGYAFRGGQLISSATPVVINLTGRATYQVGNTAYTVPLNKQLILNGKVKVGIQSQVIR
jgi:hypothetical protein